MCCLIKVYSPGWHGTQVDPPASASPALAWRVCQATCPTAAQRGQATCPGVHSRQTAGRCPSPTSAPTLAPAKHPRRWGGQRRRRPLRTRGKLRLRAGNGLSKVTGAASGGAGTAPETRGDPGGPARKRRPLRGGERRGRRRTQFPRSAARSRDRGAQARGPRTTVAAEAPGAAPPGPPAPPAPGPPRGPRLTSAARSPDPPTAAPAHRGADRPRPRAQYACAEGAHGLRGRVLRVRLSAAEAAARK